MDKTLLSLRLFFLSLCGLGGFFYWVIVPENSIASLVLSLAIALLLGVLLVLTDLLLKGFSLRGLTALTFGLAIGGLISYLLANSPIFEAAAEEYPDNLFIIRAGIFVACMYLASTIALRGKDEFHLVIPYMRFIPHDVSTPLAIVDTNVLIDGRIEKICASKWMSYGLIVPQFVIKELRKIADSPDPHKKESGRKGLEVLHRLQSMKDLDLRIDQSDVGKSEDTDSKIIFLASSLKALVLTTNYNLAQQAKIQKVSWLNLEDLQNAVRKETTEGDRVHIKLMKAGKDKDQAVGYLDDGSMVVVREAIEYIGEEVYVKIDTIIPTSSGKMIFANLLPKEA